MKLAAMHCFQLWLWLQLLLLLLLLLLLSPLLPLLPQADTTAILALMLQAIHMCPRNVESGSGLVHSAATAALAGHSHGSERLPVVLFDGLLAFYADAKQPISIGVGAIEALCPQELLAPLALLPRWRLPLPAAIAAFPVCRTCHAGAGTASKLFEVQVEPACCQVTVALAAFLRIVCWCKLSVFHPTQQLKALGDNHKSELIACMISSASNHTLWDDA
jgi:hypothetical protein